jgi:hypothetical protein
MLEITNKISQCVGCQACASKERVYKITVGNERFATSLHLCKKCCLQLKSLLACVNLDDVQMMSFDELDDSKFDKLN